MVRFSRVRLAACLMCHPQIIRSRQWMRHDGGNTLQYQDHREGLRTLPLKAMECDFFHEAEMRIIEALRRFAESAAGSMGVRRRLFAGDAVQGIALIDLVRT